MVVVAVYVAVLFFYTFPVAAVSTLLSLDTLEQNMPWVKDVLDWFGPGISAIVTAWLPTVALVIFMAILPGFCNVLSKLERRHSHSEEQRNAFDMLFVFQFTWIFLGIAITNVFVTLLASVDTFLHSPLEVLETVGLSLSQTSVFFMVYLTLQFSVIIPFLYLTRVLVLIKAFAAGGWHWANHPPPPESPPYHVFWSKVMLGATIGITFSNINPVSILFSLAFLVGCYGIFARSLLFDFTNQHDSCGSVMWPSASKW